MEHDRRPFTIRKTKKFSSEGIITFQHIVLLTLWLSLITIGSVMIYCKDKGYKYKKLERIIGISFVIIGIVGIMFDLQILNYKI
jgi:hypothetical protein